METGIERVVEAHVNYEYIPRRSDFGKCGISAVCIEPSVRTR